VRRKEKPSQIRDRIAIRHQRANACSLISARLGSRQDRCWTRELSHLRPCQHAMECVIAKCKRMKNIAPGIERVRRPRQLLGC
jgi:hypothetical protein